MKKPHIIWSILLLNTGMAFAQKSIPSNLSTFKGEITGFVAGDNEEIAMNVSSNSKRSVPKIVNEKALNTFRELFPGAESAQRPTGSSFYEAQFFSKTMRIHVCIDSSGHWLRTIRYYREELPATSNLNYPGTVPLSTPVWWDK